MLPYGVQPVDEDGEVIHADSDGSVVQNFDWEMEQKVWSSGGRLAADTDPDLPADLNPSLTQRSGIWMWMTTEQRQNGM